MMFSPGQHVRALFDIKDESNDSLFRQGTTGTILATIGQAGFPLVTVQPDLSLETVICYPEEIQLLESEHPSSP